MLSKNKTLNAARQTLRTEAEALLSMSEQLNENFELVVRLILNNSGRLIISGIGKSANVAVKIVATLNSTGTPAVFMHAADATHGDLGIVQENDIVMILSKSGNTPEIKLLATLVKDLDVPLIAITTNPDSTLAKLADYILITPVEKEADPFNLVPTVSTTLQMALGDAIAIAILEQRRFTQNDFAKNHPGGTIGKQLLLKVKDIADRNLKPAVRPDTPLKEIIAEITAKRVGATAVLNGPQLTGIITDGDIRRMLQKTDRIGGIVAADIMTRNPKTVKENVLAAEALKIMKKNNINQLIVLNDQNQYTGIIHLHEILKEGIL